MSSLRYLGEGHIVSLFDESGNALRPWAERGFVCHAFDTLNDHMVEACGQGVIHYHYGDLRDHDIQEALISSKPALVMGWPPCTHMAVSGSSSFKKKRRRNPLFQQQAAELARVVETVGERAQCRWVAENPVSVLSSLWRKPDYVFDPWEFGGYLPEDDIHPRWPEYIPPRDAYNKKTCLWCGNGFVFPAKKPVERPNEYAPQHRKLGGKSAKTKQIRSEGPRGFLEALFRANVEAAL